MSKLSSFFVISIFNHTIKRGNAQINNFIIFEICLRGGNALIESFQNNSYFDFFSRSSR